MDRGCCFVLTARREVSGSDGVDGRGTMVFTVEPVDLPLVFVPRDLWDCEGVREAIEFFGLREFRRQVFTFDEKTERFLALPDRSATGAL